MTTVNLSLSIPQFSEETARTYPIPQYDAYVLNQPAFNAVLNVHDALQVLASNYRRDGDKAEEYLCNTLGFLADTLAAATQFK